MKTSTPFALVLVAACATAPPATKEAELGISMPAAFGDRAGGERPAASSEPPIEDQWWRSFADPGLDALIDTALTNNRDLQAAVARLEAAAATRTIAGAPAWPEVDATLQAQRARRLFLGFPFGGGGVPSSTTTTFGLSLGLSWELDVWGRVRAGDAAAIADQEAAVADFAAARLSLTAQVSRAWFAAVEAQQQLRLAEGTVLAFRGTADDVRDRYRRGLRPALDVHLADTNVASAEAVVHLRREQLQRARRQLDVLAGRYPNAKTPTPDALVTGLEALPAGLPSELLQRRPDLVAAERRVAAAGSRTDAASAALYPRFALTASGGTSSTELENLVDDDFRVWSLGANLLAPLFRGGALRADVAQKAARRAEALAAYGGAVLRAFAEVEDVLATETELFARRQSLARAAAHAAAARDLARQRWQLGLADFLAVADGQRQAFRADEALIALDRQRLDNRIDLFLALGGGYRRAKEEPTP